MIMTSKIYIAGHTGLVGSSLVRYFSSQNSVELVLASRQELDLTQQSNVSAFLKKARPDVVIVASGKVGGIQTNSKLPAEFIYQNLMMEANVIHGAYNAGVKRLLNFGSACIYPKECPQPMTPDLLMTGKIEPTNEPYAIAKLAGMSLCSSYNRQYGTSYINAIPGNLFGPGDCFDLDRCHVISALIRKFHEAKVCGISEITLWGSGQVLRDFLYIDDLPPACDALLESYYGSDPVNIAAGEGATICQTAGWIAEAVGYKGKILWDISKPDGAPSRVLEASVIKKIGWKSKTHLKQGFEKTYQWFLNNIAKEEKRQCVS